MEQADNPGVRVAQNDELNKLWGIGGDASQVFGAPTGLPQSQAAQENGTAREGNLRELAQGWFGGRNLAGTGNGYNTPFYEEMFKQEEEAARNGTLRERWKDPVANKTTGIVTYDRDGVQFGDIFYQGQKLGNMTTLYGTEATNTMMAQLYWSATEQADKFRDPEKLSEAVQAERQRLEFEYSAGGQAEEYRDAVDARITGIQETAADEALGIGGGALGGAATGAGIGAAATAWLGPGAAVGAIAGGLIGGVVGGIAGWLNRDEITASLARGQERAEIAEELGLGGGVVVSEYAKTAGEVGTKFISPTTNLLHGTYDLANGGTGNRDQAWYAIDPKTGERERSGWWTGADLAAGFTDAALQFGSAPGRALFQLTMASTIAGSVGGLVGSGGQAFDERRGGYDKIYEDEQGNFTPWALAAGIGNVGIDAIQLGAARGFGQLAKAGTGGREVADFVPEALRPLSKVGYRLDKGKSADMIADTATISGGFRYARDASGAIIGRRLTTTILAPSEAVRALAPRVMGMRSAATKNGALTFDDLYKASAKLDEASMATKMMLVNGFGEGAEEGLQAVLEPLSHGYRPDPYEIFNSYLMGFAMGAGMGASTRFQQAQYKPLAKVNTFLSRGGKAPMTKAQWRALGEEGQAALLDSIPSDSKAIATDATKRLEAQAQANAFASVPAIQWALQVRNEEMEAAAKKGATRVDAPLSITKFEGKYSGNSGVMSLQSVLHNFQRLQSGRQQQLEGAQQTDPAAKALLEASQPITEGIIAQLERAVEAHAASTDPAEQDALVEGVNGWLDAMYDSADEAEAFAATWLLSRDPQQTSGSWVALKPQVSAVYTREGIQASLMVSDQVIQVMGGDYDGDQFRTQNLIVQTPEVFAQARSGVWRFGADGGPSLLVTDAEAQMLQLAYTATTYGKGDPGLHGVAHGALQVFFSNVERELRDMLVTNGRLTEADFQRSLAPFKEAVEAGSSSARPDLIFHLWTDNGALFSEWGREERRDFALEISDVVLSNLADFQRAYSVARPNAAVVDDQPVREYPMSTTQRHFEQEKAATEGQSMYLATRGWEPFRQAQVRYGSGASPVKVDESADQGDAAPWVAEMLRVVGGKTQTDLEIQRAKDQVVGRVFGQVKAFAAWAREQEASLSWTDALPVSAQQRVPQVVNNRYTGAYVTLGQYLLQQSVEQERRERAAELESNDALVSKLAKLERLARPGRADGAASNASLALNEIMGHRQLFDILGNDTGFLRPELSMEQTVRWLVTLPQNARTALLESAKEHPLYGSRKDGHSAPFLADESVKGYRAIVDAIADLANHRLATVRSGAQKGEATGEYAAAGRRVEAETGNIIRAVDAAITTMEQQGWAVQRTPEGLRHFFNQTADASRMVMEMLDPALAPVVTQVVEVDGADRVVLAPWFYDLFDGRSAEHATATLWLQSKLALWNRFVATDLDLADPVRSRSKIKDRTVQLLFDLTMEGKEPAFNEFWNSISDLKSVREIERKINTTYRLGEAPTVAFYDDVAAFEVDLADEGWGQDNSTTSRLEKMQKATRAMTQVSAQVSDAVSARKADRELWESVGRGLAAELRPLQRHEDGQAASEAAAKLTLLRNAIARAKRYGVMRGSNIVLDELVASIRGVYENATDKGKGPGAFERDGQVDATGLLPGRNAPTMQQLQQMTALDIEDAVLNPGLLAREALDFLTEDGVPITWEEITAERLYEISKRGPEAQALLQMILNPIVQDSTAQGSVLPFFLSSSSVSDVVLDNGPWSVAMLDGVNEDFTGTDEANFALFSLLGGRMMHDQADRTDSKVLAALSILRTGGLETTTFGHPERQLGMAYEAMRDVAPLLRAIGQYAVQTAKPDGSFDATKFEGPAGILASVQALARGRKLENLRTDLGMSTENAEEFFDATVNQWAEYATREVEADQALPGADKAARVSEIQDRAAYYRELMENNLLDTLIRAHGIKKADAGVGESIAQKQHILTFLQLNRQTRVKAFWAQPEIDRLLADDTPKDADGFPDLGSGETGKAAWALLSQAVIATRLDDSVTHTAINQVVPAFPGLENDHLVDLWNSTGEYIANLLLDPKYGIPQAMMDIVKDSGAPDVLTEAGLSSLPKMFARHVYNNKLGVHTPDTVRATIEAYNRIDARSAGSAIGMIGNAPKDYIALAKATQRSWTEPAENLYSTGSIPGSTLFGDDQSRSFSTETPAGTQREVRLREMHGRFARGATATFTDAGGQQHPVNLWELTVGNQANTTPYLGRRAPQPSRSDLRSISPAQLQQAVKLAAGGLQSQGITVDSTNVSVEVEFLHPDSKPAGAEWANNAFFDGIAFAETGADGYDSIISAFIASGGGLSESGQTFALQANKKGRQALRVFEGMSRSERELLTADWQTDLAGSLHNLADWMMRHDPGDGMLSDSFYNAIYKILELRHVVRAYDPATQAPVLYSAREFIAMQTAGTVPQLENVELVRIPEKALTRIIGIEDAYVSNGGGTLSFNLDAIAPWAATGAVYHERMERVLSYDETKRDWVRTSLLDSKLLNVPAFGLGKMSSRFSPPNMTKYAQDIQRQDDEVQSQHLLRRQDEGFRGKGQEISHTIASSMERALEAADYTPAFESVGSNYMTRMAMSMKSARAASRDFFARFKNEDGSQRAAFIYDPYASDTGAQNGVYTEVMLENLYQGKELEPAARSYAAVRGDLMVIDASRFARNNVPDDKQLATARRAIEILSHRGVTMIVVPGPPMSSNSELAGQIKKMIAQQPTYRRLDGANNIFVPREPSEVYVTQRARASTLTEISTVSPSELTIDFISETPTLATAENSYIALTRRSGVVEVSNIARFDAIGGFNLPATVEQRQYAADRLRGLFADENGRAQIVGLAKLSWDKDHAKKPDPKGWAKAEEALRRDMEEALTNGSLDATNSGLAPNWDTPLRIGSLRVLMNKDNQIVLWRNGMEGPGALREEMFKQGPGGIAVYSAAVKDIATTYEGRYFGEDPKPGGGTRLHVRADLASLGGKWIQDQNGMKYLVTYSEDGAVGLDLPENIFRNGRSLDGFVEIESTASKNAILNLVVDYQSMAALLGWDIRDELIEAAPDVVTTWEAAVEWIRAATKGVTLSELEVDAIMRGAYDATALQQMIPSLNEIPGLMDALKSAARQAGSPHSQLTPAQRVAFATIVYMTLPHARLSDIVVSGALSHTQGLTGTNEAAIKMPPIFTQYFDLAMHAEQDSTLHRYFLGKFQASLEGQVNTTITDPDAPGFGKKAGATILPDFRIELTGARGESRVGFFRFTRMRASTNNPALNEVSAQGKKSQGSTHHSQSIAALALGAQVAYAKELDFQWNEAADGVERFSEEGGLHRLASAITNESRETFKKTFDSAHRTTRSALVYESMAHDRATTFRTMIDMPAYLQRVKDEGKSVSDAEQAIAEYQTAHGLLRQALQLSETQGHIVDYLVRQWLGKPGGDVGDTMVSPYQGRRALTVMLEAVKLRGELPLSGSMVPLMDVTDLHVLYERATSAGATNWLKADGVPVKDWQGWVEASLGVVQDSRTPVLEMFHTALDGFMLSYANAGLISGKPLSMDMLRTLKLLNPETNRIVSSMFEGRQASLTQPVFLGDKKLALAELLGDLSVEAQSSDVAGLREEVLEERLKAAEKWQRKRTGQAPEQRSSIAAARRAGAVHMAEMGAGHGFARGLLNISFFNRVLNPKLLVSSFFELGYRQAQETAFRSITGTGLDRATAMTARNMVNAGRGEKKISLRYTAKEYQALVDLAYELGGRKDAVGAITRDVIFEPPHLTDAGRIEKATHGLAKAATWFASPTRGMRGQGTMRRYLEAVMDYQASTGEYNVPVMVLVDQMKRDPDFVRENMPNAHIAGERVVGNLYSMSRTVPGHLVTKAVDKVANSERAYIANTLGVGLKLSTQFSNFFFNLAINLTGAQAANQAFAVALHGRKTPKAWLRTTLRKQEFDRTEGGEIDFSELIDSADLTDAVIRSGMTHMTTFTLGLAAGGLNLTGEDEEDRRRRLANKFAGTGYLYDPRKIENDFRNAGAIYLDSLPPFLSSLFYDEGSGRSMGQMNWVMRQFLSPAMGMARYFETGNAQELVWGYSDAIGAMPVVNTTLFYEGVKTFNLLNDKADYAAESGTAEGAGAFQNFMMMAVGSLERMLMENAFVNELYVGWDEYDRDPWMLPAVDDQGTILRNKLGVPTPTDALQDWTDEDGNLNQGYVKRGGADAAFHNWSEKRLGFALMASLFDGFSGSPNGFLESDFLRQNMGVKTRKIDKPALDVDEAKSLILSVYDQETDSEMLTIDGAKAVIRGLEKGSVKLGDPSLENLYIPFEMREQIEADWRVGLVAEGIDMGLSPKEAEDRADELWYGPYDQPEIQGLRDIVWSDQISAQASTQYYQLNTTYVMGPDGLPWATGVSRNVLHNAFGFSPLQRYGIEGGLPTDSRLNSIDERRGINTGLRALQRVDESWEIPDNEELTKRITDAIEDLKLNAPTGNGYNGWGYGGGRGSGGSYTRLYAAPRNDIAYGNGVPTVRSNDPLLRRANIQRQRFSSERGRLKTWQ